MDARRRLIVEHPVGGDPAWRASVRRNGSTAFFWKEHGEHLWHICMSSKNVQECHEFILPKADDGIIGIVSR